MTIDNTMVTPDDFATTEEHLRSEVIGEAFMLSIAIREYLKHVGYTPAVEIEARSPCKPKVLRNLQKLRNLALVVDEQLSEV